ncbi:Hypothetical_protein [Hexamita inflata]|uniref:Hypothetical_protein n=1 Tax=Hexamita inflata TaxID=28002 RepID=A0AA86RRE2_9EUKA|nr:Hypothetical protein HINF_LOCUS64329 [Hexamita inflata]
MSIDFLSTQFQMDSKLFDQLHNLILTFVQRTDPTLNKSFKLIQINIFNHIRIYLQNIQDKPSETFELPEISSEQLNICIHVLNKSTLKQAVDVTNMLKQFQPILDRTPFSQRFAHEVFKHFQLIKSQSELLEKLKQEYEKYQHISISKQQLQHILCLNYNRDSYHYNELSKFIKLTDQHQALKLIDTKTFLNNLTNQLLTIEQYNDMMNFVEETPYVKLQQIIPNMESIQIIRNDNFANDIINEYVKVLNSCKFILNNAGKINVNLYRAASQIIPIAIYKSLQMLIMYPEQYQIVGCLLYTFYIPIVYVNENDIKADTLVVTPMFQDLHLKQANQNIHQIVLHSDIPNAIVHHIDSNEFHNEADNLVLINVTEDEVEYFKEMRPEIKQLTPHVKHQMIHKMLNSEYSERCEMFHLNCINLVVFNSKNSYYKRFIANWLNNPEQLLYEYVNSGVADINFDIDNFIKYISTQLD